jgi:hypothetical protein
VVAGYDGELTTGTDGCTDTTHINYNTLAWGSQHYYQASHSNYEQKRDIWHFDFFNKIVNIQLLPLLPLTITKSSTPTELVNQSRMRIAISFTVNVDRIGPVRIDERLAPSLEVFGSQTSFRGPGVSVAPIPTKKVITFDVPELVRGTYILEFDVVTVANLAPGSYPIDAYNNGTCSNGAAQVSYMDFDRTPQCQAIPAGSFSVRRATLTLNSDAWIGDRNVIAGNVLKIEDKVLIISGREARLNNPNGSSIAISNYVEPLAGKLKWDDLEKLMLERVKRAKSKGVAVVETCPATNSKKIFRSALHLNGSTLQSPNPLGIEAKTWVFINCDIELENVEVYGTGTIINARLDSEGNIVPSGGSLVINGNLTWNSTPGAGGTFGYIGFGNITLAKTAQVHNAAFYTTGTLVLEASSLPVTHMVKLIAKSLRFPDTIEHDMVLDRSEALLNNPPPLFGQFYLPGGRDIP